MATDQEQSAAARAALFPLAAEIRKLRALKWTYTRIGLAVGISATAASSIAKTPVHGQVRTVVGRGSLKVTAGR